MFDGGWEMVVGERDCEGVTDRVAVFVEHVLLVSGRASFEIIQKALAAGVPILYAVSVSSNLAVEFARESGQPLVGFLRGPGMNIYSYPEP